MDKILFVVIFFGLLYIKNIEVLALLAGVMVAVYLLEGKIKLFLKALNSVLLFNLGVSLGYIILAYFKNISPWEYLVYINLKVIVMSSFVFYFFSRVGLVEFFSFSKDLSYLLTITLSQIYSYKKVFVDFRDALRARSVDVRSRQKEFIAKTFKFFMNKALNDSKERALGMKARGFFNE
ncbi:MAG: hypothetical protein GXO62_08640 [Epsilonproteobacteria bacterium]|nr:hypothetical protein [Campylobacterota bacterium]